MKAELTPQTLGMPKIINIQEGNQWCLGVAEALVPGNGWQLTLMHPGPG
jgi:hypothetical protein